jgi:hypothetical protein
MKRLISSLVVGTAFLTACTSGSSSDKGNADPFAYTADYNPTLKPDGAMSFEDAKETLMMWNKASKELPSTEAYADQVVDGDKIVALTDTSSERREALAGLSDYGKTVVGQIKANCQIEVPTLTVTGEAKNGSSKSVTSREAVGGAGCPIVRERKASSESTYTGDDTAAKDGSYVSGHTSRSYDSEKNLILDPKLIEATGFRSMDSEGSSVSTSEYRYQDAKDTYKFKTQGAGEIRAELSSGEKVLGDFKSETVVVDGNRRAQYVLTLNRSRGVMRFVSVANGEDTEYYINGQKLTKDDL